MDNWIFVDTNIYLDFYRMSNDLSMKFLEQLKSRQGNLVMTYQVEMEFKKNRQSAILTTLGDLSSSMPRPVIFSDDASHKALQKAWKNKVDDYRSRLREMLQDPISHDPVFTSLEELFTKRDDLTLPEASPKKKVIVQRAKDRSLSGYPPRKSRDSIGDAVNWEWLMELASQREAVIHLVSRDSDFGVEHRGRYYLNDWLTDEFHARAANGASISLAGSLAETLKKLSVRVSKTQEAVEDAIIARRRKINWAERRGKYVEYLKDLSEEDLHWEIDSKIADTQYDLLENEYVCGTMAETNATDWQIDNYEIRDVDIDDQRAKVEITFHATGEQDDEHDRAYYGTRISGTAMVEINEFGEVRYTVHEAEVDDDDP